MARPQDIYSLNTETELVSQFHPYWLLIFMVVEGTLHAIENKGDPFIITYLQPCDLQQRPACKRDWCNDVLGVTNQGWMDDRDGVCDQLSDNFGILLS